MRSLFCFLVLIGSQVYAQKQKFAGNFMLGYLNGKDQSDAQLMGGVSRVMNDWQLGVATGIDNYKIRSVPLMFSAEKYFSNKINKPFLFTNQGLNIPWEKQNMYHNDAISEPKYKPGLMFEGGGGYALKLKYQRYFVISVGYSLKQVNETYKFHQWNGLVFYEAEKELRYSLRRLVIKCGINF